LGPLANAPPLVSGGLRGNFSMSPRVSSVALSATRIHKGGNMHITRNPGRVAGLWYLILCVLGPLRLIYIPTKLFVSGNALATTDNIAAHQWLFRFGIVADLLC